ncbi:3-methyl-2-oxobutanoate hydroxymethyltransferase [Desulfovibrio sp. OttesenSCG-928-M16]|nr:3-methyl-2-oxobutanoate hydroxymethyltransferase [Desulfovibrio sp. OttesenSCG-928-M16]
MKQTVVSFRGAKEQGKKLAMLTAYDYSTAKIMDGAGLDAILVGDSLGMVCLGYTDTLCVTMEDMIHHSKAVARGVTQALLVTDMPFMSYQCSVPEALKNAGRLMAEGRAQAVKVEGGVEIAEQIRAMVRASIPVMGHIGLTPQSVHAFGGFKVQGKDAATAQKALEDARAVQEAGAFSVVLECIPGPLAARITAELSIPTIGIGAGPDCDGQVLVWQDMLGLFPDFVPKFVKHFGAGGALMHEAFARYTQEVHEGSFPGPEHVFGMTDDVLEKLY